MSHPTDLISAMLLLGAITADYSTIASTVRASASVITIKVQGWTREDSIGGVIEIESDLIELASSLCSLSDATYGIYSVDIDSEATILVVDAIVELLDVLASKANDFKAVGASGVVARSLALLQAPSQSIVGELIAAASDSTKGIELRPYLQTLETAVNTVNPAYGIPPVHFPTLLT